MCCFYTPAQWAAPRLQRAAGGKLNVPSPPILSRPALGRAHGDARADERRAERPADAAAHAAALDRERAVGRADPRAEVLF